MGEIEIITNLAAANIKHGDSLVNAIDNAKKQFDFAVNEALNYEFKGYSKEKSVNIRRKNATWVLKKHGALVHTIARKFNDLKDSGYFTDIIQVGQMALIKAYEEFDVMLGNEFSTYAYKIIWGNMQRFVREFIEGRRRFNNFKKNIPHSFENGVVVEFDSDNNNFKTVEMVFKYNDEGFENLEAMEMLDCMYKLADELAEKFGTFKLVREIITLKLEDFTNSQVAEMLDIKRPYISIKLKKFRNEFFKTYPQYEYLRGVTC